MNINTQVDFNRATMMVYGCGGTGSNIVSTIIKSTDSPVFCETSTAFVDTSMANVRENKIPADRFYHITRAASGELLDGSGRVRGANPEDIIAHVPAILNQFPPADVNVVIGSGGGGSGSVIAPSIVDELLRQGKIVIPIIIGSYATRQDVNNTTDTIRSYFVSAENNETALPAIFIENSPKATRGEINRQVLDALSSLCLLFSRAHKGLDSKDLEHFLHYTKTAKFLQPSVAFLAIGNNKDDLMDQARSLTLGTGKETIVTLASLASDQDTFVCDIEAGVHFEGFTGNTVPSINSDRSLFFAVMINVMEQVLGRYQSLKTKMRADQSSRVVMSVDKPVAPRVGSIVIDDE